MRIIIIILIFFCVPVIAIAELKCPELNVTGFPNIKAYVNVLDSKGDAVVGLNHNNFELYEDKASISDFDMIATYSGQDFLSAVLIMDMSGSMRGEPWKRLQEATLDFLSRLSTADNIALLAFNDRVRTLVPFTSNKSQLKSALAGLKPKNNTALYDAIIDGVKAYDGFTANRRAIIILSDGKDTSSHTKPDQTISIVKSSGIPIYVIGLGKEVNVQLLSQLADASGGSYFPASSPDDLLSIYRQIAGRLQNQYQISYHTNLPISGSWHNLDIIAKYSGANLSVSRSFLANPKPLVRFIKPYRGFMDVGWLPIFLGSGLGLLVSLIFAVVLRVRGVGDMRHRILIIIVGLILGMGAGAILSF